MTKEELLKKYSKEILQECAFWEDTEPYKPFIYKVQQISKTLNIELQKAEEALKDYQHFMEY